MDLNGKVGSLITQADKDILLIKDALENQSQEAFNKLHKRYYGSIFHLALKRVGDREEAEDIASITLAKAFKHLNQYNENFAFSTWLFRIANNNCIDYSRKKKIKKLDIQGDSDDENEHNNPILNLNDDNLSPQAKLIRQQKHKQIHNLIDNLSDQYKELVVLRYFEELSYEEIAEKLNIPMGTVKAKLFRAKEKLHEALSKSGIRPESDEN